MTANPLPRVVIDTQVWVFIFEHELLEDFASKQPYRAILEALEAGRFIPIFTPETLEELHYMLTESRDVAKRFNVDVKLAEYFITAISAADVGAVMIEIQDPPFVSSDPDDDYFIEAAVVARARYLVSEDSDLHEPAVMWHLNAHGVRVLYPHQFRKLVDLQRKGPPAT